MPPVSRSGSRAADGHQSRIIQRARTRQAPVPGNAAALIEVLARKGVLGGVPVSRLEPQRPELADLIIVAATETSTAADRSAYAAALQEVLR